MSDYILTINAKSITLSLLQVSKYTPDHTPLRAMGVCDPPLVGKWEYPICRKDPDILFIGYLLKDKVLCWRFYLDVRTFFHFFFFWKLSSLHSLLQSSQNHKFNICLTFELCQHVILAVKNVFFFLYIK